jgi:activator of 2-hydroxyglutaryl-CoA dehydratase
MINAPPYRLFLQQMAKLMHLSLAEMSELSFQARNRADITGTCAVFPNQK